MYHLKMVINTKSFSKIVTQRTDALQDQAKDMLCPLILGCYDKGTSEEHLHILNIACKTAGFTNSLMLQDIPDAQPTEYNLKFKLTVGELKKLGKYVCPIFYIHPATNSGFGKGLISEFFDIPNLFSDLREFTIILKYPEADFVEQLNYIHHCNIYPVSSIEEAIRFAVGHLNGHLGFLKQCTLKSKYLKSEDTTTFSKEVAA